jgi:hypothetical protein
MEGASPVSPVACVNIRSPESRLVCEYKVKSVVNAIEG